MITLKRLLLAAVLTSAASAALALDADDVLRMTRVETGDEVILELMEMTKARFSLTADDVVRLKKEGVSDRVLAAMIRTATNAAPAADSPAAGETADRAEEEPPAAEPEAGAELEGLGTLVLENLDSRDYSVQIDVERGRIFYWKGVASQGRDLLPAGQSLVYRISPGSYSLRWVGGSAEVGVRVRQRAESRAVLSRTAADGGETLHISVFESGEARGGGRLAELAEVPSASEPVAERVVERHYYYAQPSAPYVLAAPAPATYYARPRYYRSHYVVPGFVYTWRRGHSRYAVGWGPSGCLGFTYGRRSRRSGFRIGIGW
jgi:hypothetical protein